MSGKPKPTTLRVLEGNRGKRDIPENEPKPRLLPPSCPPWLDPLAKKTWKTLAPKLERLGLLTEVDGDMFADLCQIRSRLITIYKFIKKSNKSLVQVKVTIDGSGQEHKEIHPSPYVVMEKQYQQLFRMAASEFGLSPRGRVGLSVGYNDPDDGADLLS